MPSGTAFDQLQNWSSTCAPHLHQSKDPCTFSSPGSPKSSTVVLQIVKSKWNSHVIIHYQKIHFKIFLSCLSTSSGIQCCTFLLWQNLLSSMTTKDCLPPILIFFFFPSLWMAVTQQWRRVSYTLVIDALLPQTPSSIMSRCLFRRPWAKLTIQNE